MENDSPFFSIIIVCLNAEKLIKQTIRSIQNQTFKNYEVIIKDGGSSDITLSFIPKDDNRFKVVCSKDSGIYDAMNQAIQEASGRYYYFLNCGDTLLSEDILQKVYEVAKNYITTNQLLYGDVYRDGIVYQQPEQMYDFYLYRTSINHQSTFWGRELFNIIGIYRTEFKSAADYELEVKAFHSNKIEFKHLGFVVCEYLSGGYTDTAKGKMQTKVDFRIIRKENFTKCERLIYGFIQIVSLKKLRRIIDSENAPVCIRKIYRKIMNQVNRKMNY